MKYLAGIIAAAAALIASVVYATNAPGNLSITASNCYGSVMESGDAVCILGYNAEYATIPSDPIDETFLVSVTATNTLSAIRSAAPVPFVNSGYGNGIASIYFDADDVDPSFFVWGGAHQFRIQGNPSAFGGTIPTIGSSIAFNDQNDGVDELKQYLIDTAIDLETKSEWNGVDLITAATGKQTFTDDGQDYFTRAIVNLKLMTPSLFQNFTSVPNLNVNSYENSYQTALDAQWNAGPFSDTFSNVAVDVPAPESTWKMLFAFAGSIGFWALGAVTLARYRVPNGPIYALVLGMMAFFTFATIGLVDIRFIAALLFLCVIAGALWIARTFTTDTLHFFWMFAIVIAVFGNVTSAMFDITDSGNGFGASPLTADVGINDSSITVNDASFLGDCTPYATIYVGNEAMTCESVAGNVITVSRSQNNTEAVEHSAGVQVYAQTIGELNQASFFSINEIDIPFLDISIPYPSINVVLVFTTLINAFTWDYSWMTGGFIIFRYFGIALGIVAALATFLELIRIVTGAVS